MTTRETLKNFLSNIGATTDSISYTYDTQDNANQYENIDLGKDPGTDRELIDIENEGSGLLGDYLNYITENSTNIFKIAAGIEKATASKRGDSLTIAEEQGAENVFVTQGTENFKNLSQYSNSGKFQEAGEDITEFLDKTGGEHDAHNLYGSIEGNNLSTSGETLTNQSGIQDQPVKATNSLLSHYNRFANVSNKTAFAPKGKTANDLDSADDPSGTVKYETKFGKADIDENISAFEKLKDLGASLLIKASGFDSSEKPVDALSANEIDAIFSQQDTKSNFYSESEFNKVPIENIRPRNAKGTPVNSSGDSIRAGTGEFFGEDPNAKNSTSFGASYNSELNFLGKNRKMLKLQAAIVSKALIIATKNFMDVITETIRINDLRTINEYTEASSKRDPSYMGAGKKAKGVFRQIKSFELDMIKKLLLVKTNFNYSDCIDKGLSVFFGNDLENTKEIAKSRLLSTAPGFWLAIASSVLKSFDQLSTLIQDVGEIEGSTQEKFLLLFEAIKSNKILQFANAAATVGDIALKQDNGLKNNNGSNSSHFPFDVDKIETTAGTRFSKSKENDGPNPDRLAWRQSSVPSMYLLPRNVLRATLSMNNVARGSNPVKAMMASEMVENTYLDRTMDGSSNRIPNDVVKRLEDKLDAEYVPFYIQDLRTNEIISFHAFLTTLSDSINPNFSTSTGYGRLDPIQTYNTTTRSVTVGFSIIATSKEDYNQMWYKINKLTTLLYPQWTQGTKLSTSGHGDGFIMPFSQVLGASPIVRLRVGDVIKSNYSKFNLARLFGIGDPGINPMVEETVFGKKLTPLAGRVEVLKALNTVQEVISEIYYLAAGTPLQYIPTNINSGNKMGDALGNLALKVARDVLSNNFLKNGFINPIAAGLVMNKLSDPNSDYSASAFGVNLGDFGLDDAILTQRGKIKANMTSGYLCEEDGEYYYISRPIDCQILKVVDDNPIFENIKGKIVKKNKKTYKVKVLDSTNKTNLLNKHLFVSHDEIIPDISDIFLNTTGALFFLSNPFSLFDYASSFANEAILSTGIDSDLIPSIDNILLGSEAERFMSARNNPFVRAYETTMGRGLAGVLGNVQFNWLDDAFTWETDYNSRAPKGVSISLSLNVIHDIAPGLDHSGYNRAPLYNVGDIMKEVSGDAHGNDDIPEYEYRKGNLNFKTGE